MNSYYYLRALWISYETNVYILLIDIRVASQSIQKNFNDTHERIIIRSSTAREIFSRLLVGSVPNDLLVVKNTVERKMCSINGWGN